LRWLSLATSRQSSWPTDAALHRQFTAALQAALGDDYEGMLAAVARDVADDQAIAELSLPQ
jgi:hypothetical protein